MTKELQTALLMLQPSFIKYLETLRDKTHSVGSNRYQNTNAVFVSIGRNLVIDEILSAIEEAKNPKTKSLDIRGSDVIMSPVKEQ